MQKKENEMKDVCIGQIGQDAWDLGWENVLQVPSEAAWAWTLAAAPEAIIGASNKDTVAAMHLAKRWSNKVFVTIAVSDWDSIAYAIYLHDGEYWLVKRKFERVAK